MTGRRITATRAQALIAAAELVRAPDWSDTRHWHVTAGGQVLVVVAPSYGGVSRSGRNGWRYWLAETGPAATAGRWDTREQAAAAGLAAWERWATRRPSSRRRDEQPAGER